MPITRAHYVPITRAHYVPITRAHYVPITYAHYVPITYAHYVPITYAHCVPYITPDIRLYALRDTPTNPSVSNGLRNPTCAMFVERV